MIRTKCFLFQHTRNTFCVWQNISASSVPFQRQGWNFQSWHSCSSLILSQSLHIRLKKTFFSAQILQLPCYNKCHNFATFMSGITPPWSLALHTFGKIPIDGAECGLLQRIAYKAVIELNEWMTSGQDLDAVWMSFVHRLNDRSKCSGFGVAIFALK